MAHLDSGGYLKPLIRVDGFKLMIFQFCPTVLSSFYIQLTVTRLELNRLLSYLLVIIQLSNLIYLFHRQDLKPKNQSFMTLTV